MGVFAMLLATAPAQAQSWLDRIAQIRSGEMMTKYSPEFNKEQEAKKAELKAIYPKFFQCRALKPTQERNNNVTRVPLSLRPRGPFKVTSNGNGQILMAANNTSLIANVAYFPGIQSASERSISRFSANAPTTMESLVTGNYTFFHGAAIQDDIYYGVYLNTDYIDYGYWWIDYYSFNAETWEVLGDDYIEDLSMIAEELATASDGTVYGAFWNESGDGVELGIPDYANQTRTTIGTLQNDYVAMGITKAGQLYGIASDGNLYKIDKSSAAETLVGSTGITISDDDGYYYQTGEIDQKDDTFYWLGVPVTTGECNLYTVNLQTGAATLVQSLGEYNITGLLVERAAAEDGAPAAATNLAANFANGSTTGTISFTAPTQTYGGSALSGTLNYSIKCDEAEVAKGTTSPGKTVSANVTLPEGMQTIKVIVSNSVGDSPAAKLSVWIGYDVPKAPTNVVFTYEGTTATVKWDAVTESMHDGYMGNITYNVYRIAGEESKLVAEGIKTTTFSETLKSNELTLYNYGVEAVNNKVKSSMALSNGVTVGDAYEIPYFADFTNEEEFNLYTVIDANNDGSTFAYSNGARYKWNSNNAGDDWIMSPPIHMKAGKAYKVVAQARAQSANYPERFEVKVGKAPTADAMTITAIGPSDVTTTTNTDFEGDLMVEEEGNYYVGIHAISNKDQYYLYITSISIEAGADENAPQAVTNLTVTPDDEGYTAATISFVAPTKNIGGNALSGKVTADIYRDDTLIKSLENVTPGSKQTYDDTADDLTIGTHTYYVVCSNASGPGMKSEKVSAYIGVDIPAEIEEVTIKDNIGTITLNWDLVTEGANGGVIIPDKMDYVIWSLVVQNGYLYLDEKLDSVRNQNSCTITYDANVGEQGFAYFLVQPKNEAGEANGTVGAFIVGKPFELPLEEHFANGQLEIPGWFSDNDGSSNISFTLGTESSDGDGYCIAVKSTAGDTWGKLTPGKIKLSGATNPTLIFDVKSTSTNNQLFVIVEKIDGTEEVVMNGVVPTSDFQTINVDLKKYVSEPYVFVKFYTTFDEAGTFSIDNIFYLDQLEYNLAATNFSAPKSVKAGDKAQVKFTVKNFGKKEAKNYNVKVTVADEVLINETVSEALAPFATKDFEATYNTTIFTEAGEKAVKAVITYANDLKEEDNTAQGVINVIASSAAGVENLTAEEQTNGYKVTWDAPSSTTEEVTEDFEDTSIFPPFDLGGITDEVHEGAFGDWKLYDGTGGARVYGFQNASFENMSEPHAWQVINPSEAGLGSAYTAPSGNQFLLSVCPLASSGKAADHWLISPELAGDAQTIKFTARTITDQYGAETFEILVSKTDAKPESFTLVKSYSTEVVEWTEFTCDLPAGSKYFAIRHTSNDIFGIMIDDIVYTAGGGTVEGYNVYVDEEFYSDVTDTSIDLSDVSHGNHKISVTAVYANGVESAPESVFTGGSEYPMGDVDHNGYVNVTDVMMAVNYFIGQAVSGFHLENADFDKDGSLTVSEIMQIVNIALQSDNANSFNFCREATADKMMVVATAEGYDVSLCNNEPYTALQMDVCLEDVNASLEARLSDARADGHKVICNKLGNGCYRIIVYSLNGQELKGNDGILLQLLTNSRLSNTAISNLMLTNRQFESITMGDIAAPTGIAEINASENDAPAYNVQGIRSKLNTRGIVIQNGKKHVKK